MAMSTRAIATPPPARPRRAAHALKALAAAALLAGAVALVLLATSGSSSAAEAIGTVPNPVEMGSHTVTKVEYYGGSVMMDAPNINGTATAAFQQPLDGALFYPNGGGPFPLIVLLHGNHADCLTASGSETTTSASNCASTPGNTPLLNYEGYDYMAENLASHGYIVISLDADALTSWQTSQDNGTFLRDQLLSASLDMAFAWEDGAPLYVQTAAGQVEEKPPLYSTPYALAGHINLENGVGLWGHSRGGEGVADFVAYNRTRPSPGRHYKLAGVMSWAPVDYERTAVIGTTASGAKPASIPYASVLPLCDGDVSDIHGARIYEKSLYAELGDPSPKMQFAFQGGDHDYSNTLWSSSGSEDGLTYLSTATRPDAACGEDEPGNIRLTPSDQQKLTTALTAAFMRRYVGGEKAFEPLMTGEASLPTPACPSVRSVPCGEEVKTTYFAPAEERRDVLIPEINATALTEDALGGTLSGTGFKNPYQSEYCVKGTCEAAGTSLPATTTQGYDWCNPEPIAFKASNTGTPLPVAAKPCPLPPAGTAGVYDPVAFGGQANERENDPVNRSFGPQLSLAWEGTAQLNAEIPASAGDVSHYGVLALDAAINYFDSRNPPSGPNNPIAETNARAAMQDFEIELTDRAGHTAIADAADPAYGTALEAPLGSARRNEVLNEIRVPLSAFAGVDLQHVAKVSLIFGNRTPSGSIQVANMRFQEPTGASGAPATSSVSTATLPAASNALVEHGEAIPLDGTNRLPSKALCTDTSAPTTKLAQLTLKGGLLIAAGSATDAGCAGAEGKASVAGSVQRVQISLARVKGGMCSFIALSGTLQHAKPCTKTFSIVAKGTTSFHLTMHTHLPAGAYRVLVQGIDHAGNLEKAHGLTVVVSGGSIVKVVK